MTLVDIMISFGGISYNEALSAAVKGGHNDVAKIMILKGATKFNKARYVARFCGYQELENML